MRAIPWAALNLLQGYNLKLSSQRIIQCLFVYLWILPDPNNHQNLFQFLQGRVQWVAMAAFLCAAQILGRRGMRITDSNWHVHSVANIKLPLDCKYLLPNKFILNKTDLPAYAPDKMFKWCWVVFSNENPEHFSPPPPQPTSMSSKIYSSSTRMWPIQQTKLKIVALQ